MTESSFACEVCGAEFRDQGMLRSHAREAHSGAPRFACRFCTLQLATAEELSLHERLNHTAMAAEMLPCPGCGLEFADAESLEEHVAREHPRFPGITRPA